MERYEEYKDSGIEWIGEIPAGWEIKPLKGVLEKQAREPLVEDEIITCFRDGEVTLRANRREDGFTISEKEIGYQHVCKGDFVIHGMDGFAGAMGISNSDGKASPVLLVFKSLHDEELRFISYLLRYYAWQDVFLGLSTSIRVRSCDLNWKKISLMRIVLPGHCEQVSIADYLDKKTAEIDALVGEVERSIELLGEYRRAVISEAVTKGLDSSVPTKDSGIEWIGEIPAGWKTLPFLRYVSLSKGLSITKEDLVEEGIPVISYGQIHSKMNDGTKTREELLRFVKPDNVALIGSSPTVPGDIVFADTSEDVEGCGNCLYIERDGVYAGYHTIVARPRVAESGKYLAYLLQSKEWRAQIRRCVCGVKLFSVTKKVLAGSVIVVPALSEQQSIADFLDKKTAEIDALIQSKKDYIAHLREYKKSLISEAVTGKFKVPGVK